jgi:hypothetical protein
MTTQPTVTVEEITPIMAADLLSRNINNRNLREKRVNAIAADLLAGRFVMNGDAIRIDTSGNLLDGQHRLAAVVQTGQPIKTIVVRGLPPETITTIDTGAPRKFSDVLQMQRRTPNATIAAAITTVCYLYNTNRGIYETQISTERRTPTREELLEFYDRHADTIRSAQQQAALIQRSPARLPSSATGVTLFAANFLDVEVAERFTEIIVTGDSDINCAARQLREYGIRRAQSAHKAGMAHVHTLTVRAWNRWIAGEPVTMLRGKSRQETTRTAVKNAKGLTIFPFPVENPTT